MNKSNMIITMSPSGISVMLIIFALLAYFVYDHSINAVIGVTLMTIIISVVFALSFIPVVGWLSAILLCHYWVIPKLLDVMALDDTWLITFIFTFITLYGFIITIIVTVVIVAWSRRRRY